VKTRSKTWVLRMNKIDDRQIKLGLYFPLLKGWREWGLTRRNHMYSEACCLS